MRIGLGFDIHPMASGRPCVIGGITIPHAKGPAGHSDGDVLLHALVDAILGAASLGDIGGMFPDTDPIYKDVDSKMFVTEAFSKVRDAGYEVTMIDSVVFAEAPRLGPYRETICQNIASMLSLEPGDISVKGKTFEGFGAIGREEAIAAQVVVLLHNTISQE